MPTFRFSKLYFLLITIFALILVIPLALAALAQPTINPIASPIDATKSIISGTTIPNYKIIVTGGPYEIPPTYADDQGNFEVTVALTQETTNIFNIQVENSQGEQSEPLQINIIESASQAAAAEASGGGDHTAPAAPIIDTFPQTIDAAQYTFTGSGEAGATLNISGSQSKSLIIDSTSHFSIVLTLLQNTINTFNFVILDPSGNISPSTKITITEKTEANTSDPNEENTRVLVLNDISGHWAENYIIEMINNGDMQGYDDHTFRPNNPINRAEFTKTILEALNYPSNLENSQPSFPDVTPGIWYATYVATAKTANIIQGFDDNTFRPGDNITRAEALKILLLAGNIQLETKTESPFKDVPINEWYTPYILTAYHLGIVNGYQNGDFGPGDNLTRAQVTKIVMELKKQL